MPSKEKLRKLIRDNQDEIAKFINVALRGKKLRAIEPILKRVGRGGVLPHWYQKLKSDGVLPNLDGKTIGSVVEMLLVGILESSTFAGLKVPPLRINPARGIDLPDLDLGVKSPSENYCTSEPFFSAYERLLGGECDVWVLLTDYQEKKDDPPLRLQIIKWRYLSKTQVADWTLCGIARKHRDWLLEYDEATAKKVFRFLAYVNQSDWRARWLLRIVYDMQDKVAVEAHITNAAKDFEVKNKKAVAKDRPLIAESELESLQRITKISPIHIGVVNEAESWVIDVLKDAARAPSNDEWSRLKASPLDGMIGMSFALQWRYNFGRLFGVSGCEVDTPL